MKASLQHNMIVTHLKLIYTTHFGEKNLLKLDIVDRLDGSWLLPDAPLTVLCRDLLLEVMLFLLGELSLFKLDCIGLRGSLRSNMDIELRGATTPPPPPPALLDLPLTAVTTLSPSLLLLRRFLVRSRILVRAPPALELRFSALVDSTRRDRLEPRRDPFLSAVDRRSNTLEGVEGAFRPPFEAVGLDSLRNNAASLEHWKIVQDVSKLVGSSSIS